MHGETAGVATMLFIVIPIFIFIFIFIRYALGDKPECSSGVVFNVFVEVNVHACGHVGRASRSSAVECPVISFCSGGTNGAGCAGHAGGAPAEAEGGWDWAAWLVKAGGLEADFARFGILYCGP